MNIESAKTLISEYLREQFGKVVALRGVRVVRRASGRHWIGDVFRLTHYGDVQVGSVGVNESGRISADFGVEELIDVLSRVYPLVPDGGPIVVASESPVEAEADLRKLLEDSGSFAPVKVRAARDDIEHFFVGLDTPKLRLQIRDLLGTGRRDDLIKARDLLPLLLPNPDGRGEVLRRMAELEILLGDVDVALTYLEAASREFSDRADLATLEQIVDRVLQVVGYDAFVDHPCKHLLDQTMSRLTPMPSLNGVRVFAGLDDDTLRTIEAAAEEITVDAGHVLIREEDTPVWAFVVRSGALSVWVEPPSGGSRFVRCCFPGEFVGESSVLGSIDATCTATVRAQRATTLWEFSGFQLRALVDQLPELRTRLEHTQMRHRLDSFFSTGEATATLDVRVRDRLLSCFVGIHVAQPGETVVVAGTVPEVVYLFAEGRVETSTGSARQELTSSTFIGLRSALHRVPMEFEWMAAEPSRLVVFDADKLRALAASAPPEVVGILETLE